MSEVARENERLRFALDAAGVGEWDLDLRTGKATRSLMHDRIFGYESRLPEWTFERFLEHVQAGDRERVAAAFRDAVASRRDWDFECRIRRADGHERWIWARGGHQLDPAGRPLRLTGLVRDVTDHRLAEEASRQSAGRYRALFESIDAGFCILQLIFDERDEPVDYRFVDANPAFERQTGLSDALGRTARELVPDLERSWFEIYGRVALTGEPTRFVDRSEPMGRWFDVHAFRIGDPEERRVALLFDDITERKRLEGQLASANAELERRVVERTAELEARTAALSAFAEFTEAVGTKLDVAALNARAVEVVERALAADAVAYYELEGELWRATAISAGVDPVTRAAVTAGLPVDTPLLAAAARLEPTFLDGLGVQEGVPESALGEVIREYAAAAAVPVVADGALRGLLSAGLKAGRFWQERDRAVVRAVARGLAVALERAEASAQLAAQKAELEARNAEQETFVYTVSHDLRAPLLSIQGMGELLREAVGAGDAGEAGFFLTRIGANVAKMGALLDDLLALSRAGRGPEPTEPLNLRDALRTVLAELEPLVARRGAVVEEHQGECPPVLYSRVEAEQVLANLLSNAVKFAGRPGEPPMVRVTCEPGDGGVLVKVEDNGPGVPAEHRERVFGLFQRLDARTEGNGVGLAIVRRIAERHGGRAWVEDSELGGASFAVTMPAAE